MISFVIFEKDNYLRDVYGKVIKRFLSCNKDYYDIYEYKKYDMNTMIDVAKIQGKKIYLINIDLPGIKSGFEFARKIRLSGDYDSSIIMVMEKDRKVNIKNIKDTLVLNIVENNSRLIPELMSAIECAYVIVTRYNVLTISVFDEIYRIPYDDIVYMEKTLNGDLLTIYTKNDSFELFMSIKKMMKLLNNDARFFKCSRSCIINIFNIDTYLCVENKIIFRNGDSTNMISRDGKHALVEILKKQKIKDL